MLQLDALPAQLSCDAGQDCDEDADTCVASRVYGWIRSVTVRMTVFCTGAPTCEAGACVAAVPAMVQCRNAMRLLTHAWQFPSVR